MILTFLIAVLNYRGTPDAVPNVTMLHEDNNTRGNNVMKNVLAPGEYMRRIQEEL